jgi:hypothetical protein
LFFLLWWSSVFIMFCVLAKFKILFYSPKTFRVKPKSLEEFLNMVVGLFFFSWSFWKHWWSRTAPGLQPNKVFNATVLFFCRDFFLARNKKNAASKYKSARKQCQVSWSVRLGGVLRSALVLNLHMICLTC